MEYAPKADSPQILSFSMGKNTPERKDYIMENLVVPVKEWGAKNKHCQEDGLAAHSPHANNPCSVPE